MGANPLTTACTKQTSSISRKVTTSLFVLSKWPNNFDIQIIHENDSLFLPQVNMKLFCAKTLPGLSCHIF